MKVGKVAGQVGHGAVGLYRQLLEDQQQFGDMLLFWNQFGFVDFSVSFISDALYYLQNLHVNCYVTVGLVLSDVNLWIL